MSSKEGRDTFSQGVQTIPHLAAHARNIARSRASYHHETVTFNIRREPSGTGSLIEVTNVFRRTRIPGLEYNHDPDVQCYTFGSEILVREVMASPFQRRRAAAGNASASAVASPSIHSFLTALPNSTTGSTRTPSATSATPDAPAPSSISAPPAPAKTRVSAGIQTRALSCVNTRVADFDDEVEYLRTVYPVDGDSPIDKAPARARRGPYPTRQLKMVDYFTRKKLKYADLPPSLLTALSKSEAYSKGLSRDFARLKQDISELVELKAEADAIFEEIKMRFQPSSASCASASAVPLSITLASDTSSAAAASPQANANGSAPPYNPASASVSNHSAENISDEQYLMGRIVARGGKHRVITPSPLKRRASSALAPPAKKPRTKD